MFSIIYFFFGSLCPLFFCSCQIQSLLRSNLSHLFSIPLLSASTISIFFLSTIKVILISLFPYLQSFFGSLLDFQIAFLSFLLFFSLYLWLDLFHLSFFLSPSIYFSCLPFLPYNTIHLIIFISISPAIFFAFLPLLINVFLVHKVLSLILYSSKDTGTDVIIILI